MELTLGPRLGWPPWTWISLALAPPTLLLTVAWERRLTRRGGDPVPDLPLFRDGAFSAGPAVNVGLDCFFASFMFVLPRAIAVVGAIFRGGLAAPPSRGASSRRWRWPWR